MAELKAIQARIRESLKRRDAEVQAFVSELQRFLEREIPKAISGLKDAGEASEVSTRTRLAIDTIDTTVRTARARGTSPALEIANSLASLEDALRAAGLGDVLKRLEDIHYSELDSTLDEFEASTGQRASLTETDLETVDALIGFQTDAVSNRVATYLGDMKPIIMGQVLTGAQPDLSALQESLSPSVIANIQTELDTGLSAFHRTVNVQKAQEAGLEFFLYIGPDDQITRPFCQKHVGNVYTLKELEALDNGQDLPVIQYCGGYNCRHQLRPVDEETAKRIRGE